MLLVALLSFIIGAKKTFPGAVCMLSLENHFLNTVMLRAYYQNLFFSWGLPRGSGLLLLFFSDPSSILLLLLILYKSGGASIPLDGL